MCAILNKCTQPKPKPNDAPEGNGKLAPKHKHVSESGSHAPNTIEGSTSRGLRLTAPIPIRARHRLSGAIQRQVVAFRDGLRAELGGQSIPR